MSLHTCPDCEREVATNSTTAGAFAVPPTLVCVECGVEYVDPSEISKSVTMDGEVVVRHDEQATLVTDGGRGTDQCDDPHADDFCVVCGRHPEPGLTMHPVVDIENGVVCEVCTHAV